LKVWLSARSHDVIDLGTHDDTSVDYPDFASSVGRAVASGKATLGVLVCGSGIGMSIAANKIEGIRAAHCTDCYQARVARQHNDANVLCLGSRVSGLGVMEDTLESFLRHAFEGGRHATRVEKIKRLDRSAS
jgi:ribose 5-phosphate isomerase B